MFVVSSRVTQPLLQAKWSLFVSPFSLLQVQSRRGLPLQPRHRLSSDRDVGVPVIADGGATRVGLPLDDPALPGSPVRDVAAQLHYNVPDLRLSAWQALLRDFPDRVGAARTLKGIQFGEGVGFAGRRERVICRNRPMNKEQSSAVEAEILRRVGEGQLAGPFTTPPAAHFRCSPVFVVPKGDGFRLIHDLSHPVGFGVNDGISTSDFPCNFARFDDACAMVCKVGPGCVMGGEDMSNAYRQFGVRAEDLELLGMQWGGHFYVDTRLVFGCRSSAGVLDRYATQLEWAARTVLGISHVCHFADDWFFVAGDSLVFGSVIDRFRTLCDTLGVDLNIRKRRGPLTCIAFLGIIIDSVAMVARMKAGRVDEALQLCASFLTRARCSRRELQQLVGRLMFIASVVRPGRLFLSRAMGKLRGSARSSHHIKLGAGFRRDMRWWLLFLRSFNGIGLLKQPTPISASDLRIGCDASDFGGGAFCGRSWFFMHWPTDIATWDISARELCVIVVACATWGATWEGRRIVFDTDSSSARDAIMRRRPRSAYMGLLTRQLHFIEAQHGFTVGAVHIAGVTNGSADALSRGRFGLFRSTFLSRFGYSPNTRPCEYRLPHWHELA